MPATYAADRVDPARLANARASYADYSSTLLRQVIRWNQVKASVLPSNVDKEYGVTAVVVACREILAARKEN